MTQLGTISQIQIERLGRHIFTEGSLVIGGQLSLDKAISLNLDSQYVGTDISVSDFVGKTITDSANNLVSAYVVAAENSNSTEPPTLMIKYLTGDEFNPNDTLKVVGEETYANVANSGITSSGMTASISDGIFFTSGYFVKTPAQTILLSKYNPAPNVKIGLEFSDSIVDENDDTSLLDPAQESSNYQGPGATRYKIELVLAKRSLDSVDDEKFIELSRIGNGIQLKVVTTPIYSELEETFARRTYDESGNYTVRPFRLELKDDPDASANLIARLDPGKAYIFGYEYETISPTDLSVERTRDYETDSLYDISTAYGNYVVVKNIKGFPNISTMPVADLHCVNARFANNSNATTYSSTKIGTVRIRNFIYETASNTANGQTHTFRAYIFDPRLSSITGNATNGSANTITLNSAGISSNNDAYNSAIIRITAGTSSGDQKKIIAYNGSTKVATVDSNFTTTPDANSTYSINFTFKEVESLIIGTGGSSLTANLDIDLASKDDGTSTGNTVTSEALFQSLVFQFPNQFIKTGLSVNNYQYRKVFTSRTFTAGVGTITAGTGEALIGTGALSDSVKRTNYTVIVNDPGTSAFTAGQVISFDSSRSRSISVSGSTATLNANDAGNFTADIIANIEINSGSETNPKIKTLVSANTFAIASGASNGSFISANNNNANTTLYLTYGQAVINNPNKTPNGKNPLYVADIKALQKVYDLNGATVTGGATLASYTDVTNRFTLDNGQRDTFYDHGAIYLKSGVQAPKGPLVVCFDYYNHGAGTSDGYGYFSVDSYPDATTTSGYANIPTYQTASGDIFRLSDAIDFRPKRQNASNTSPGYTLEGIRIPTPNEEYTVTYDHYFGRKDLVVLSKDRTFRYIKGISGQFPTYPNDPPDAMVLYRLELPPYVLNTSNIVVNYVENKRYTMRDIGKLEQRIQNLEYYTTLNFLEKDATDIVIRDANGLERTKYGIIADKFVGHQIGDVYNYDYRCSMDFVAGELRPFFSTTNHILDYAGKDTHASYNGTTVTLAFTEEDFVVQNNASTVENVQPFLIARFLGNMVLSPDSDIWVDTQQLPDVVVNLSGANDAWQSLLANTNSDVFGTEWNDWQTRWTGTTTSTSLNQVTLATTAVTTTTTKTGIQTRTGVSTQLNFDTINETIGDRVLDVSVIPYIRPREVDFQATNLRPSRQVYYFFDGIPVQNYIIKPNVLKLNSGTEFIDKSGLSETITSGSNTASVLLSRIDDDGNTQLFVAHTNGTFKVGQTISGSLSGNTATIAYYDHFSGNALGGTVSTINLASSAANTNDYYTGNTIFLAEGLGVGQNSSISSYNGSTRVATVSSPFSVSPSTNTVYSIGVSKTTPGGSIVGTFAIPPSSTGLSFRTGERIFQILDDAGGDTDGSTTRADGRYEASGLLQTKDTLTVSVKVPEISINSITETRPVTSSVTNTSLEDNYRVDPLAQTFFVDSAVYPNGVFLSSVDLFFKNKDTTLPVWVEIRPTVNGFPHSSMVIPFSKVTLTPNKVNTSDNPNAANSSTVTTFTFTNPVYLETGKEYALVVQTNSLNYEAYVSELGKKQIGTDRIISEQPYLGSLFKSQNASTWTPFQYEDLMFVLRKCVFDTSPANIYFNNRKPTSNASMDWMYVQTGSLILSNTSVNYAYEATNASDLSQDSSYTNFNSDTNYRHAQRKIIRNNSAGSLNLRATLVTTDADISPVLDTTRFGVIAIENKINNANLSNTNIVLTNDGTGYVSAANVSVTITGDSSTSANAYVGTVSGGNVTSIIMDAGGSYYLDSANITFAGGGATVNAVGVIASELNPKGGPALSKYITRKVTLNEGFDAGDLRVYLTAYKPIGTQLVVYAKIRNSNDTTLFENRPYFRLAQITPGNRYSKSQYDENDLIEYEYHASANTDAITYVGDTTTYDTFNEFAIKIVLLSDNTTVVPVVKDFRCVALPSG